MIRRTIRRLLAASEVPTLRRRLAEVTERRDRLSAAYADAYEASEREIRSLRAANREFADAHAAMQDADAAGVAYRAGYGAAFSDVRVGVLRPTQRIDEKLEQHIAARCADWQAR